MARHKEFDPEQALDKAMHRFWQCGYDATSIEDLVEATGVSRYGLYSTFGGKHDLFLRALGRYRGLLRTDPLAPLLQPQASLEQVRMLFERFLHSDEASAQLGCLMANTAAELGGHDEAVEGHLTAYFDLLTDLLGGAMQRAEATGELPAGFDAVAFTEAAAATLVGTFVMSRSPGARPHARRALAAVLKQIDF